MTTVISRRSGFSIWPIALAFNALLLAACVFIVTQEVKQHEASIAQFNRQILAEQQTMRVLDAEWAYLTRPQRLEELLAMREATPNTPQKEASQTPVPTVVDIEPSVGTSASITTAKPKALKKVEKPAVTRVAEVKAVIVKPKKTEKIVQKKAEPDIVWSIKRQATQPKRAQLASGTYPVRAGVAKPILE
ncbi:MAG: hypothetical protein EBQ96_05200 [Proteobacteria bacterium]|nr:hypothetical protein [Pseudomonadota bacterium]